MCTKVHTHIRSKRVHTWRLRNIKRFPPGSVKLEKVQPLIVGETVCNIGKKVRKRKTQSKYTKITSDCRYGFVDRIRNWRWFFFRTARIVADGNDHNNIIIHVSYIGIYSPRFPRAP